MILSPPPETKGSPTVIDISEIHMIQVISDVGSMNKAAELLHISQPTLSKKVSRLEQKLKLDLFLRDSAGMVPTAAARVLLEHSAPLKAELKLVERKLELMAGLIGGSVNIGVGPIVEQIVLPKVLLDFAEQDYQFKISVVTLSQQALVDQLKRSDIDLAIGPFADDEIPESCVAPLKMSDKLVIAVRKGHALSGLARVGIADFIKYKTVSPNIPTRLGHQVMQRIRGAQFAPDIICDNYGLAKTVVANSDFITAGPESLFRQEFATGELVKIDFPGDIHWQCRCLAKPETLLNPIVQAVFAIFSQYMTAN